MKILPRDREGDLPLPCPDVGHMRPRDFGRYDADIERQQASMRRGMPFIPRRADHGFLMSEARRFVKSLREAEAAAR
jgi:hypothetical protein